MTDKLENDNAHNSEKMVTNSLRGSYLFCERSRIQAVTSAHAVIKRLFYLADLLYIARIKEDYVRILLISVAKANIYLNHKHHLP